LSGRLVLDLVGLGIESKLCVGDDGCEGGRKGDGGCAGEPEGAIGVVCDPPLPNMPPHVLLLVGSGELARCGDDGRGAAWVGGGCKTLRSSPDDIGPLLLPSAHLTTNFDIRSSDEEATAGLIFDPLNIPSIFALL